MKNSRDPCGWTSDQTPRLDADRQVVLWGRKGEDPLLGTMEDIKISIVNDKVTGTKRDLEEPAAMSPCGKRFRSAVFCCSTPSSAPLRSHSPHSLDINRPEWALQSYSTTLSQAQCAASPDICDEIDDTLLELTYDEVDSPCQLTEEQIEELLEDDSCYAAEPPGWDTDDKFSMAPLEPVSADLQTPLLPCRLLAGFDAPPVESEFDLETSDSRSNIYATMAPLPCSSSILALDEVPLETGSGLCTVKTLSLCGSQLNGNALDGRSGVSLAPFSLQAVPGLGVEISPAPYSSCVCSAESPSPASSQRLGDRLDDVERWSEGSDLPFDCDIDELLMLNPGDIESQEEDENLRGPLQSVIHHKTADPVPVLVPLDHLQLPLPLSSASTDPPKDDIHCRSSKEQEPKPNTEHSEASAFREAKDEQGGGISATQPDAPVRKLPAQVAPAKCKQPPSRQKKLGKVTPLPKPVVRPLWISPCDMEERKRHYLGNVFMHVKNPDISQQEPRYELAALLQQISRDDPSWQHPADLTRRNHPRRGTRSSLRCSLHQWVLDNGGTQQRFQSFPTKFDRSPIP
ncbi:hypothetical protein FKM82_013747 [Ascaphus truei]